MSNTLSNIDRLISLKEDLYKSSPAFCDDHSDRQKALTAFTDTLLAIVAESPHDIACDIWDELFTSVGVLASIAAREHAQLLPREKPMNPSRFGQPR